MQEGLTLSKLQQYIKETDHDPDHKHRYFLKLVEEVGELSEVIRKDSRMKETGTIKGTIEEELYDVLYYVAALANVYEIELEDCFVHKEKINRVKWGKAGQPERRQERGQAEAGM
ncbi:nucleotide pyrophosphohydrolase [Paenibacillus sp. J31TS4]|uniref:MazG nucleotide pyrophosphohydrolase domain-containing protein n=1 Tax=Paenibacillus sp. J31TS4 TaxID=2807195 RepID=UPI001B1FDAAD|nr:MazG nucleotide pyrophosphohydrolase domain-containing protein [Paenibacillus sp. J31TS4]GIP37754.1 nucleotide pyrophosphohydrolase [Paenibacillus sp. J31TS4]